MIDNIPVHILREDWHAREKSTNWTNTTFLCSPCSSQGECTNTELYTESILIVIGIYSYSEKS